MTYNEVKHWITTLKVKEPFKWERVSEHNRLKFKEYVMEIASNLWQSEADYRIMLMIDGSGFFIEDWTFDFNPDGTPKIN